MADTENTLILETTQGPVTIEMRPDLAPGHVARIKELVREGFYDGIVFHRVIDGFMAQTGCPQGTGTGGSGKKLKAEFNAEPHVRGTVSMARAAKPGFRRQPVLHLLRRRPVPGQPVHRLGQRDRRAWRTSTRSSAASRSSNPDKIVKATWRWMRRDRSVIPGASRERRSREANPRNRSRIPGSSAVASPRNDVARLDAPMRTDLFDFELPADRIALRPAQPRDAARLLVVEPGARACTTAPSPTCRNCCSPGDQLVVNDTKVIAARLKGRRIGRRRPSRRSRRR